MATDQSTVQATLWGEEDLPRKRCGECGTVKPVADFSMTRSRKQAPIRSSRCKSCGIKSLRAAQAKLKEEDPEEFKRQQKKRHLRHALGKLGISERDYREMMERQKGVCAICGLPETQRSHGNLASDRLSVDHCHKTGKVRGLLCKVCNRTLGLWDDSMERFKAAVAYLERTNGTP